VNTIEPSAVRGRGWRYAAWLLGAVAVSWFCLSHADKQSHQLVFYAQIPVNLALAWGLGLLARASWSRRIGIVVLIVALPVFIEIFMLFFGCAIWNTIAHQYRCGL